MIPLSTDRPIRCTPWVTYTIIGLNVLVALAVGLSPQFASWTQVHAYLYPDHPRVWQFVSYQFLHDPDHFSHLGFNMLFLWIFGRALEDRFGPLGYACFYLAGGIVAGLIHALASPAPVLGASGAISAVTGMFLALFPQTRIRILWLFILISIFEWPSLVFISLSIARDLWGQLTGAGGIAYSAHLAGNFFGLLLGLALLLTGLSKRDGYDLLSMIRHWRRRQHFRAVTGKGYDPWSGRRSAPPESMKKAAGAAQSTDDPTSAPDRPEPTDPDELERSARREEIGDLIRASDLDGAATLYEQAIAKWPAFILGAPHQLDMANHLYRTGHYESAAHAYKRLLEVYPTSDPSGRLRLLLGVALTRHLARPGEAVVYLEQAVDRLSEGADRDLARQLLDQAVTSQ